MSRNSGDALAGAFLGGLVGLAIGAFGRKADWEKFSAQCEERANHATFSRVKVPFAAYEASQLVRSAFSESYAAYFFGLPNSSITMSIRALEICLKTKYRQVEGKGFQGRLIDLIEWAEKKLKLQRSDVAQSLRMLRNEIIHEDKIVDDVEALETLRHASEVMCEAFPFRGMNHPTYCPQCKMVRGIYPLTSDKAYIGYSLNLQCNACGTVFLFRVNP